MKKIHQIHGRKCTYRGEVGEDGDAHEVGDQQQHAHDDHGVEEVAGHVVKVQVSGQGKPAVLLKK